MKEDEERKDIYAFYDKSQKKEKQEKRNIDRVEIEYPAPAPTDGFNF